MINNPSEINMTLVQTESEYDIIEQHNNFMSDSNDENNSDSPVFNSHGNCDYFSVAEFNELKNKPSGLSLFALYCRSLNSHWHDLNELLCSIMHVNFHFTLTSLAYLKLLQ